MEDVLAGGMDRLHGWLLGLPWVVERPRIPDAPGLRWFAVDCEPLVRRRIWLLTGPLACIASDDVGLHVVLPTRVGRRLADAGDGALVAPIGVQHSLVSLRLDARDRAAGAGLERVLLVGYEASFG